MAETRHTEQRAYPSNQTGAPLNPNDPRLMARRGDPRTTLTEPGKITYRPGPGDPRTTEAYGRQFKAGEAVEVPGHIVDKAAGNPSFSVAGQKTYGDERPDQPKPAEEQEPASFEQNVARERSKEYLEGRTHFASPPGEADRVARAQEQARELQDAVADDEDADPEERKRRAQQGRSPKHKPGT